MITSNPEHKKATLKKLIQAGKIALSVSLAGTVATVTIFVHTNIIKRYDIDFKDDLGHGYGMHSTVTEMIQGEIEDTYADDIIEGYNQQLEEKAKEENESKREIDLVYNVTKKDSDIVELSDNHRYCVLKALNRHGDYSNPDIKITVSDLRQVTHLTGVSGIYISGDSDVSWLNYCDNLYAIDLYISKYSIENIKQIQKLNAERIDIDIDNHCADEFRVELNENNFPFLKNNKNVKFMFLNANIFDLNTPLLTELSQNAEYSFLELYYCNSKSKKVDVETLQNWPRVTFTMGFGKGTYDFACLYTHEEVTKLINSGIELEIFDSDGKRQEVSQFFKEVSEIHQQIDKIVESLNINDKMTDNEKLENVIEYVLNNLTYSETSSTIQKEEGYKANVFGNQPTNLVNDLMENSYKDGYLYGALNENGKPVCGSYAELMKVLLDRVGVEIYHIGSQYHAYNLVNVDGEYYYVDATFLDKDVIDMDEITKNNQHLINPHFAGKDYKTVVMPEEVTLSEPNVEARVQEVIDNVKKEYLIKFNNQIYNVSFTMLMSILAGLGLAVSKKKLENIEDKEIFDSLEDDLKLQRLVTDFEWAKDEYDKSNPFKKAYLKLSGKANFKKMQEEIEEMKGIKK